MLNGVVFINHQDASETVKTGTSTIDMLNSLFYQPKSRMTFKIECRSFLDSLSVKYNDYIYKSVDKTACVSVYLDKIICCPSKCCSFDEKVKQQITESMQILQNLKNEMDGIFNKIVNLQRELAEADRKVSDEEEHINN